MRFSPFLLMLAAVYSQAATVTIGTSFDRPPYIIQDSESGFELEVIRAAFAEMGKEVKFNFYSRKRAIFVYEQRHIDGLMTIAPNSGISGFPSESYVTYFNTAISLKSRQLKIDNVADLSGYSMAAFQNAASLLGDDFHAVTSASGYREVEPQQLQNKLLYLGRVDVVLSDKYIFMANSALVADNVDTKQALEFHDLFERNEYFLMFQREVERDTFNQGLAKLKSSGKYQALQHKYFN